MTVSWGFQKMNRNLSTLGGMDTNVPLTILLWYLTNSHICSLLLSLLWFSVSFSSGYLWVGNIGCAFQVEINMNREHAFDQWHC